MGQYNKAVLTTAGEKLIARALAGEIKLNITKAKTSDFAYPENADLKRLTDMQGVRQTVCDPETVVFNETIIQTRVLFSNEDIASTYYIHNIGLYAMDGTHEVLFSIVTAEMPDEMPQYNGVASTSYIYNIQNVVQDAAQLNISVNPSGTATIQDVLERVDAIGGDISETVIETLDTVESKYPVPSAGESVKRFFGKVLAFMKNIRPLTENINIYVSTTGSDILGDGTSGNPFKTIQHAIDIVPKDLGGYTANIMIADGIYNENVTINAFHSGILVVRSLSSQSILNTLCNVKQINIINCAARVHMHGLYFTQANDIAVSATSCAMIYMQYCQAIESATSAYAFDFIYSPARLSYCKSMNHRACVRGYLSTVQSENWFASSGTENGLVAVGGIISKIGNQPSGTNGAELIRDSGVFVSKYGGVIGTLTKDISIYVSNAGSDTTGDGTSSKPFATIQFAIDTLPKDLGGYAVTINVANGTYPEVVRILGFNNGEFRLYSSGVEILSDNCKIDRIDIRYNTCLIVIAGFSITTTAYDGIIAESCISVNVQYTKIVGNALSSGRAGIGFYRCCTFNVWNCQVSYHQAALIAHNSRGVSNTWATCVGNNYGLYSTNGSVITTVGTQPAATTSLSQDSGGMFTYGNGSQIAGPFTSGLSCTWGTFQGGYVRHGMYANGQAMVTINIRVTLTTSLTAGTQYTIYGFPGYNNGDYVPVTTNVPATTSWCYLNSTGTLLFAPTRNFSSGEVIMLSATYMTNS